VYSGGCIPVTPTGNARAVIEELGDHLAGRPVLLQLQHHQLAVTVDGQKVEELAVGGRHLAANDHPVGRGAADVLLEDVLQALLRVDEAGLDRFKGAVNSPDSCSTGHCGSSRSGWFAACTRAFR